MMTLSGDKPNPTLICRWHMEPRCMRFLLRLMRLRRLRDGKLFFEFLIRKMWTLTEGVARECWGELVKWYGMPGLRVDMCVAIDVDDVLLRPMNAIYFEACEGRPRGCVSHKLPMMIHGTWRPLMERLAKNPFPICKTTDAEIKSLRDRRVQMLKRKQVAMAFKSGRTEFYKLHKYIYKGQMLYLWLWYPSYSRAAARALCSVVGIPRVLILGESAEPDPADKKDEFMLKLFQDDRDVVLKLWSQFKMSAAEVCDIIKMAQTDSVDKTQTDLKSIFPNYNYFLHIKYAALPVANFNIEGTFSNCTSAYLMNMSDGCLNRSVKTKQNVFYHIRKKVLDEMKQMMAEKGCKTSVRRPFETAYGCQRVAEEYKKIVDGEFTNNAVFSSEHCPTTSSFRHCPTKQITHGDKFRAEQTVNAQIAWAEQVGRQDRSDAEWAALTAAVEDPNLDSFEILAAR